LIGLAALHAIPASYAFSGTVAAGGLAMERARRMLTVVLALMSPAF